MADSPFEYLTDEQRQLIAEKLAAYLIDAGIGRRPFYAPPRQEVPGSAYGPTYGDPRFAEASWRELLYGEAVANPYVARQHSPERAKALSRCRDLKRMADSTTYEGERANAQAAIDRLKAKHGIEDREI